MIRLASKRFADGSGRLKSFFSGGEKGADILPVKIPMTNLWGWYSADKAEQSLNAVSQLTDRSGNRNHLIQATDGSKPTLVSSGLNEKPYVSFDGSNDFMATGAKTLSQPVTIYAVVNLRTWTSGQRMWDGNADSSLALSPYGSSPTLYQYAGASVTTEKMLSGTPSLVTAIYNGSSSTITINQQTKASPGSVGTATPGGFTLGSTAGGSGCAPLDVYEILIYNTATHSADDEAIVQNYLKNKYALWDISDNPISTAPLLWLDMASKWLQKDGSDYVRAWRDRSKNGYHAGQPTGNAQPQWNASTGLTFDGSNDALQTVSFSRAQAFTVFLVAKQISWKNGGYFIVDADQTAPLIRQDSSSPQFCVEDVAGKAGYVSPTLDTNFIFSWIADGASSRTRLNAGSAVVSGSWGSQGFGAGFNLGGYGGSCANVSFKEFLLYPGAISEADETAVRNYLNTKYTVF